jgi:putative exosortase-associated protein (TIGR04073 family)
VKKLFVAALILVAAARPALATDTSFSGNFIGPESQSGFLEEQYESKAGAKMLRGLKNFFLSPLEIPHGVKTEYYVRKQEYLPAGIETFFLGTFKGFLNMFKRAGVGFYEFFTFPYAQDPIIEEMEEWLY